MASKFGPCLRVPEHGIQAAKQEVLRPSGQEDGYRPAILLLYFASRCCRGKLALKHRQIGAGQITYGDIGEIPVAPASDIIAGDRLLRNGLAGPQCGEADGMCRMLVDDGSPRTIVDKIDPARQQL